MRLFEGASSAKAKQYLPLFRLNEPCYSIRWQLSIPSNTLETPFSSFDFPPPTPLPGRSKTLSAWGALLALSFLILVSIFLPLFLQESIRFALWATQPLTGLRIQSQELRVQWGKPLLWHKVIIVAGQFPHESRCELQSFSLELTSLWQILFGDHLIINSFEANNGTVFVDLRFTELSPNASFFEKIRNHTQEFIQAQLLPIASSCSLKNISFSLLTNTQSFSAEGVSFFLSKNTPGKFSYKKALIVAEPLHCELEKSSCATAWNGRTITLNNLSLAEEIRLCSLQLTPHPDRIELGVVSTLFHGLLRADGSIKKKEPTSHFQGALLVQNLPLERLSKFLGLTKKVSGNLREGRLVFRGFPTHWADAEASLRVLADNFRYGKKEWAALSMTANLLGRKLSLSNFQLKQHDNSVIAAGEMSLPQEWNKLGQAPFHLKLRADIADATQLGDLAGAPWNDIMGKLLLEGEVQGAAHSAQGYFRAQGTDMALQRLSLDAFKLDLLFKNEETDFQFFFHHVTQGTQRVSGHCLGSYTPQHWFFSQLLLQERSKQLSTTLSIFPKGIEATHLSLKENGIFLSGNFWIPIDTKSLWNGGILASSLVFRAPLESALLPHCFSLTKKILQGEPITIMLPRNFYEPMFFFKKPVSPFLRHPSWNNELEGTSLPLDIPEKEAQHYFYWK